jgi:hypothetical protein
VGFGRYLFKMLVGMSIAHFKFIGEKIDGEESTFN